MSISVNPPPQHGLPPKLLNDPELRDFFLYQQEYLFKLWLRTGGGTDNISESTTIINSFNPPSQAKINEINERIGSGDFLTGDTTGFTGDTTLIYGDLEEV